MVWQLFASFIFLILPIRVQAENAGGPYTYLYGGRTITVPIQEHEGVRVNDICIKNLATCQALKILREPSRVNQIRHAQDANFSGAYCELLSGTQLYLHQDPHYEFQFCVFSDLTMLDAKILYERHTKGAK
jgi:hypothetical protein